MFSSDMNPWPNKSEYVLDKSVESAAWNLQRTVRDRAVGVHVKKQSLLHTIIIKLRYVTPRKLESANISVSQTRGHVGV